MSSNLRDCAHHVRNAVAEEIYSRTGRDVTVPVSIYGEVIERCNYKCRYCEYWRQPIIATTCPSTIGRRPCSTSRTSSVTSTSSFPAVNPTSKKASWTSLRSAVKTD